MMDVGTILNHMRQFCDLKIHRLESSLLHVEALPRKEEIRSRKEWRFPVLEFDRIEMTLDEDTYEVKSSTLHMTFSSREENPILSMFMKPWKKTTIAFRHVKNFLAPAGTFLPPSLEQKDGEKDQDKKDKEYAECNTFRGKKRHIKIHEIRTLIAG